MAGPGLLAGRGFEDLERTIRQQVMAFAARWLERVLNRDHSDCQGSSTSCSCGHEARYAGRRAKRFTCALGTLRLERAYYHCSACNRGFCPRDRTLGMQHTRLSPTLTRMIGQVGALVSFAEGSDLLHELAGVKVNVKLVERTAEALGEAIGADEQHHTPAGAAPAPTMYLGLDGTGIPMRPAELAGRPGKQADGSARTREVKLAVAWSAESRDPDGVAVRDAGSVRYSGAIESAASHDTNLEPSVFAKRVCRHARRTGFDQAARQVILGDGAGWIWNIADEYFPDAIQIVDLFHAKGHLWDVARVLYGPTSELGEQWAKNRRDELDQGNLDDLIDTLADHADTHEEARRCLGYIERNRHRMDYPRFRAMGLCISTGVVEAGCKVAIGTRLKRAGMRWTVTGANAIIALRCCKLSGQFDRYWQRRSEQTVLGRHAGAA